MNMLQSLFTTVCTRFQYPIPARTLKFDKNPSYLCAKNRTKVGDAKTGRIRHQLEAINTTFRCDDDNDATVYQVGKYFCCCHVKPFFYFFIHA